MRLPPAFSYFLRACPSRSLATLGRLAPPLLTSGLVVLLSVAPGMAQGLAGPRPTPASAAPDTTLPVLPSPLGEPLGSGTGWLPGNEDPHDRAVRLAVEGWEVKAQGEAVLRYTTVNLNNKSRWRGDSVRAGGRSEYPEFARGGRMIDIPNWAMLTARREAPSGGTLMLRGMVSLDAVTVGAAGYPLLYQTGEGLVDRQPPQDFLSELSALYAHRLGPNQRVFAYAGMPGEPALGPAAFLHRPSAGDNPDAPLGHNFHDATRGAHGVLTAGYVFHRTKLDASLFNGRESDAQRWNPDFGMLDSWSVRLTQNVAEVSLQASYARINAPGPGDRDAVHRVTASASRSRVYRPESPLRHERTVVWAMNAGGRGGAAHAMLGEASLGSARWRLWNRWEALQRDGEELDLVGADVDGRYWLYGVSLGAGGTMFTVSGFDVFLGAQGTVNAHDGALAPYYGTLPLSAQVFVKAQPAARAVRASSRP